MVSEWMRQMFSLHGTINNQSGNSECLAFVRSYSKEKQKGGPYFEGPVNQMGERSLRENMLNNVSNY